MRPPYCPLAHCALETLHACACNVSSTACNVSKCVVSRSSSRLPHRIPRNNPAAIRASSKSAKLFCYVSSHARSHALPSLSPHMPPLPENIPQAVPLHLHPSNPAIFFSHLPPRIREPKTLVARWIFLTIISPNMPSPSLSWRRVIGNVTHHSITPASKKENSKKESRPSTRLSLRTDS